ncbi:MAG: hypothetical protein ACREEM_34430 [Blastocatellia bacterium]
MKPTRREFLKQTAPFTLAATEAFGAQSKPRASQLAGYDSVGLAELIRKKQITAIELVEDTIRRIERVNPKLNIVLTHL